jgi:hypothetical protein
VLRAHIGVRPTNSQSALEGIMSVVSTNGRLRISTQLQFLVALDPPLTLNVRGE